MDKKERINEVLDLLINLHNYLKIITKHKSDEFFEDSLSMNQQLCLNLICMDKINSMTELSKRIGISNQQTTRVIDDLVKRGLVVRERSSENHRKIIAVKTLKADEYYQKMLKHCSKHFESFLSSFSDQEVTDFLEAFKKINSIFESKFNQIEQ